MTPEEEKRGIRIFFGYKFSMESFATQKNVVELLEEEERLILSTRQRTRREILS